MPSMRPSRRLSFHLRVLKDAGLVTDRREGRWMYYTLNRRDAGEVADLAQTLATPLPRRESGCC